MKKYYIIIGLAGLLFGYFAKYDFWFEDARDTFFPITKETIKQSVQNKTDTTDSNTDKPTEQPTTAAEKKANSEPVNLDILAGNALFKELYNNKALTEKNNQSVYFEKIKKRLTSPYPAFKDVEFGSEYESEVTNRLGILRAMSHFWSKPSLVSVNPDKMKKFFYQIADNKNENLMVRRQAYKNWLYFGKSVSAEEKKRFIAGADSEMLHLISVSDDELISSLTKEGAQ